MTDIVSYSTTNRDYTCSYSGDPKPSITPQPSCRRPAAAAGARRGQCLHDRSEGRARGSVMVVLTSGCHALVARDRALQHSPLATELIRRPPVPAGVRELAPNDLALVYKGERGDSIEDSVLDERAPGMDSDARGEHHLLVHEDERVDGGPVRSGMLIATVQRLYPEKPRNVNQS